MHGDKTKDDFIGFIARNPHEGELIQGTGGARKIRWQVEAYKGKRGGARVIYYYHDENMPIFLFTAYKKCFKKNNKNDCRCIWEVKMSKLGKSLLQGAKEALAYAKGENIKVKVHKVRIPKNVDVRAIRTKLHLSRQEFANRYGFSIRTLEKWEQGVRQPEGAARAYLMVISRNHKAVELALAG